MDFDGDFLSVDNLHLLFPSEDDPASRHSIRFRHVNIHTESVAMESLSNKQSIRPDSKMGKSASAPASLCGEATKRKRMQSPDPKN